MPDLTRFRIHSGTESRLRPSLSTGILLVPFEQPACALYRPFECVNRRRPVQEADLWFKTVGGLARVAVEHERR